MILLSDTVLFALSLIVTGTTLFILIYLVITISDLECDYLNAQQCCAKLNAWVYPKIIAHVYLTCILLINGHWILSLFNMPMACWLAYEIVSVPKGNLGVYDPLEIHNRGQLKKHMRDIMIYLGYYLVFFFLYLYCMLISLLTDDPIKEPEIRSAKEMRDAMKFDNDF